MKLLSGVTVRGVIEALGRLTEGSMNPLRFLYKLCNSSYGDLISHKGLKGAGCRSYEGASLQGASCKLLEVTSTVQGVWEGALYQSLEAFLGPTQALNSEIPKPLN